MTHTIMKQEPGLGTESSTTTNKKRLPIYPARMLREAFTPYYLEVTFQMLETHNAISKRSKRKANEYLTGKYL